MLIVYRGAKLDKEEFDKLKENQGKLISTNGYLSTSQLRQPALAFAMKSTKRIMMDRTNSTEDEDESHFGFTEDDDEPHSISYEDEDELRSITETPFLLSNSINVT
ncbi:unnamed protein product [Rotaria sp. Silwood1]|nr:unnamed protein product [Rotaria sp. Silwood1]CAF4938167.1 unnamed protein product [Rotaria sp. Silwood1]